MILNDRDIWRGAWISSFKTFYGRNKWGTRRHSPYHLMILISFTPISLWTCIQFVRARKGFFFVKKGFLYKSSNHWSNKFSTAHHWKRSDAAATTCVFCGMSLTHLHGSHCEEFTNSDQPSMAMRGENSRTGACFYYTDWPFSRKSLNKVQQCLLTLTSNRTNCLNTIQL